MFPGAKESVTLLKNKYQSSIAAASSSQESANSMKEFPL